MGGTLRHVKNIAKKLSGPIFETVEEVKSADLSLAASSLAYTSLLSVIPLIAVSLSIFKAFGGLDQLYKTVEPFIFENLAEGSDEQTLTALRQFIGNIHAGALGTTGLIGLILTCMSMLASIEKTINRIWKTKIQRSLFQRVASYWLFITLGPLGLSFAIGIASSSQTMSFTSFLPSGWILFPILVGVFFGMYRWIPHRIVHWRPALIAAAVTATSWIFAKAGYSYYIRHVVTYNKIYGSLGAIPIFILWIYVAWLVVLAGAAFSFVLQRRFENVVENKPRP